MIPTRSTQQSSPASPCCCNSRPDGDNQFPEAQKPTRLLGRTSTTTQKSSRATSVPHQESTNPARLQVKSYLSSNISKDKRTAVPCQTPQADEEAISSESLQGGDEETAAAARAGLRRVPLRRHGFCGALRGLSRVPQLQHRRW